MLLLSAFLLASNIFLMVHSSNLEDSKIVLEKQVKVKTGYTDTLKNSVDNVKEEN